MRRLYFRIYLYFVGILALFAVLVSLAWHAHTGEHDRGRHRYFDGAARLVSGALPPPGADLPAFETGLGALAAEFGAELALFDADLKPLAATSDSLTAPSPSRQRGGWMHSPGQGPAVVLKLPDGRWLVARGAHRGGPRWFIGLSLLAVFLAIGAYPLARRITRRLERLRNRVEALGGGDLGARVEVEGRDEVAELATSFNQAAARIERLVEVERMLLASVSHELRTPLTRIRMAVELLTGEASPGAHNQLAQLQGDIAELDRLIDELLLASRLQLADHLVESESVELLALVAEEGARFNADVGGEPVSLVGDARRLRYMVRNLLENARRHGATEGVRAEVGKIQSDAFGPGASLSVSDCGPGVVENEREQIFEPFYRPTGMREAGQGVGLGLYLVRQIAQRHGGDARCENGEGGGARFVVTLAADPANETP